MILLDELRSILDHSINKSIMTIKPILLSKFFMKLRHPEFPDILFEDISGMMGTLFIFSYRELNVYFNKETGFCIYIGGEHMSNFFISLKDLELDDSQLVLIYGKKILTQTERL